MKTVLLPIKEFHQAKRRLRGFLSSQERRRLMRAMFEDVAEEVGKVREADQIVVVTREGSIVEGCRKRGWRVMIEEEQISESHSVDRASARLQGEGCRSVLRLPADIPLLQCQDVDDLLSLTSGERSAVLVPSGQGEGTNALLRCPPGAFSSHFGPDSRRLHQIAAAKNNVALKIVNNPRIALDLDTPDDLQRFVSRAKRGRTWSLLKEMDLENRAGSL